MFKYNKDTNRTLTRGEKIMGLKFNPGNSDDVQHCKETCAVLADYLNSLRESTKSSEVKRMCSVAITELQTAQMWAVKAITWKD